MAAPLANGVGKMTMVSTGHGEVGAAKITNEVMDIVVKVPELVEKMTGIELSKVSCNFFGPGQWSVGGPGLRMDTLVGVEVKVMRTLKEDRRRYWIH